MINMITYINFFILYNSEELRLIINYINYSNFLNEMLHIFYAI